MNRFRRLRRRSALRVTLALLIVVSALAAISTLSAVAQGDLQIPQASLRLWPEYDDPGLLVILSGNFADTASFPQKVAFPVATGARNIQATANDATQGLLTQKWQMEGNQVAYTLPQPGFHLEYYVDRPPSGNKREIAYTFEAPYPIKSLEIAVQQPARATDFSMTPKPTSTITRTDGLTYHLIDLENLAAGDKRDIAISYVKTDSGLTAPQLAVTSATPVAQASGPAAAQPKPATQTNWLPFLLIGVGLLALIGIAAYWFLAQRRAAPPVNPARPTVSSVPSQPAARPTPTAAVSFCTQCGHAFRPEDRFCAECGTPRKD
jgi:hypothetical protein